MINVWPDATGKDKGQAIAPLFKSVPAAAKADPKLYELLALVFEFKALLNLPDISYAVQSAAGGDVGREELIFARMEYACAL